nr:unnamed protein product [Digitaria exilis]
MQQSGWRETPGGAAAAASAPAPEDDVGASGGGLDAKTRMCRAAVGWVAGLRWHRPRWGMDFLRTTILPGGRGQRV